MKAENFMLCDILMATYDDGEKEYEFPVYLDGLDANGTLVDGTCHFSWTPLNPKDREMEYADDLEQIPLRKKHFLANGFKTTGYGFLRHNEHENLVIYYENQDIEDVKTTEGKYDWDCARWAVTGISGIEFVDEFQRYLRLVGYEIIANNFKLE